MSIAALEQALKVQSQIRDCSRNRDLNRHMHCLVHLVAAAIENSDLKVAGGPPGNPYENYTQGQMFAMAAYGDALQVQFSIRRRCPGDSNLNNQMDLLVAELESMAAQRGINTEQIEAHKRDHAKRGTMKI